MSNKRTSRDYLFLVIKGVFMGAANKVPGVSGGMVAFVSGFYEEFIYSLQKFNRKSLLLLYKGRFRSFFQYVNFRFLGMLILGMLISYFSVSKILDYFIVKNELYVWSLFFGMIIGSVVYILKDFRGWNTTTVIVALIGLIIGLLISFMSAAQENKNLWFIFFCGVISVSGMTLPGLSGSFILVLIGNYTLLLVDAVNALFDVLTHWELLQNGYHQEMLVILVIFTLGSMIGMVSFSQLLSFLLKKYHHITIALIIGFIMGSLGTVWPWRDTIYKTDALSQQLLDTAGRPIIAHYHRYLPDMSQANTWMSIALIIVGILIILLLEYYGKTRQRN